MSEFREADFVMYHGDIIHVYDDPSYLELLRHERETQASIYALDDENAKLRQQLADVTESMGRVEERCAKLRELVRHTVECVQRLNDTSENGGCVLCPYQLIDYDCEFEKRARELGIEVDT